MVSFLSDPTLLSTYHCVLSQKMTEYYIVVVRPLISLEVKLHHCTIVIVFLHKLHTTSTNIQVVTNNDALYNSDMMPIVSGMSRSFLSLLSTIINIVQSYLYRAHQIFSSSNRHHTISVHVHLIMPSHAHYHHILAPSQNCWLTQKTSLTRMRQSVTLYWD